MNDKTIKQAVVTDQTSIDTSQVVELIALFNSDGTQVDLDALQVQDGDNILLTGYVLELSLGIFWPQTRLMRRLPSLRLVLKP
jgi:hypothetical protein